MDGWTIMVNNAFGGFFLIQTDCGEEVEVVVTKVSLLLVSFKMTANNYWWAWE